MILLALLAAVAAADPSADPLAPAREGRLQCYTPDTAKKTCLALSSYVFAADGGVRIQSEMVVHPDPPIIMRSEAPVVVRDDGAVCGDLAAGLDQATFTMDGAPAAPDLAGAIRTQLTAVFAQLGKESCTRFSPQGDALLAEVTIDGRPQPGLNQPVIWVSPADGYVVGR